MNAFSRFAAAWPPPRQRQPGIAGSDAGCGAVDRFLPDPLKAPIKVVEHLAGRRAERTGRLRESSAARVAYGEAIDADRKRPPPTPHAETDADLLRARNPALNRGWRRSARSDPVGPGTAGSLTWAKCESPVRLSSAVHFRDHERDRPPATSRQAAAGRAERGGAERRSTTTGAAPAADRTARGSASASRSTGVR